MKIDAMRTERLEHESAPPRVVFPGLGRVRYPVAQMARPHWYALRTKSRYEKRAHRALEAAGFEASAAVASVRRKWADRTRRIGMPLFPGYIFVRTRLADITGVLGVPGAVDLVRTQGVPTPVREDELDAVFRMAHGAARTGAPPESEDYMTPGTPVRVHSGPFEGLIGVLIGRSGRGRVAIRLDALRQAKSVQIDPRFLTPLERKTRS